MSIIRRMRDNNIKMKKHIIIGLGKCKECNGTTTIKTHRQIPHKNKQFFSQWEVCQMCGKLWTEGKNIVLIKDVVHKESQPLF